MKDAKQFIVDNRGFKTSVIVPYDEWEKITTDYHKLQNKLEIFYPAHRYAYLRISMRFCLPRGSVARLFRPVRLNR